MAAGGTSETQSRIFLAKPAGGMPVATQDDEAGQVWMNRTESDQRTIRNNKVAGRQVR